MKKILKETAKTKAYLDSLPKIYGLFLWAKWGILALPWTGKYNKAGIPLVYIYHDFNGEHAEYRLAPINQASSGCFYAWYESKDIAIETQSALNMTSIKRYEI